MISVVFPAPARADERHLPARFGHEIDVFHERPITVLVTADVKIEALNNVSSQHVLDEGEGQSSVAQWREEHEAFWNSISSDRGGIRIDDDTKVVLEHFTVER